MRSRTLYENLALAHALSRLLVSATRGQHKPASFLADPLHLRPAVCACHMMSVCVIWLVRRLMIKPETISFSTPTHPWHEGICAKNVLPFNDTWKIICSRSCDLMPGARRMPASLEKRARVHAPPTLLHLPSNPLYIVGDITM